MSNNFENLSWSQYIGHIPTKTKKKKKKVFSKYQKLNVYLAVIGSLQDEPSDLHLPRILPLCGPLPLDMGWT